VANQKARRFEPLRERLKEAIRRIFKKRPEPEDPYALVGALKRPRTPLRGLRAAVHPERD
jgi:hypothetical protein